MGCWLGMPLVPPVLTLGFQKPGQAHWSSILRDVPSTAARLPWALHTLPGSWSALGTHQGILLPGARQHLQSLETILDRRQVNILVACLLRVFISQLWAQPSASPGTAGLLGPPVLCKSEYWLPGPSPGAAPGAAHTGSCVLYVLNSWPSCLLFLAGRASLHTVFCAQEWTAALGRAEARGWCLQLGE